MADRNERIAREDNMGDKPAEAEIAEVAAELRARKPDRGQVTYQIVDLLGAVAQDKDDAGDIVMEAHRLFCESWDESSAELEVEDAAPARADLASP